ncbi:hypothetical protein AAFF_G00244390 [Aldrovandia affinis]|uniref:Uncharacterized protein n=1 Tax=Aldrovandia affinis TaxID=143900 RepID=A0AAD7RDS1_9TELE|nr:hypothetical protein AAFF_G00244390 [Aldrovandia affinis]
MCSSAHGETDGHSGTRSSRRGARTSRAMRDERCHLARGALRLAVASTPALRRFHFEAPPDRARRAERSGNARVLQNQG